MLESGDKTPLFAVKQTDGTTVKSADWKDKTVVLFFYPKDDTPGWTKEACSLRDSYAKLRQAGVVILGISPDTVASHGKFALKYGLPFPLLADPDHAVAEKFGVWVEKNMYGKKSMGIARTTFILENGKVKSVINKVDVENHAEQVLAQLQTAAG